MRTSALAVVWRGRAHCLTARRSIGSDTHVTPRIGLSDEFGKHYAIEDLIGSGSFADVYRARHLVTGKQVAVKCLSKAPRSPSITPVRNMEMIEQELACMRRLGSSLNAVRLESAFESHSEV